MGDSGLYAVMPVKSFASAKQRMAAYLTPLERLGLARCMFQDVLDAARRARKLKGILVVTSDVEVHGIAGAAGAEILVEGADTGYAAAVRSAVRRLRHLKADGMIVIPSDIPHLSPTTIDKMAELTAPGGMTIVPANCDGGTNLLCVRPFDLVEPLFGVNSYALHCEAARQAGVEPFTLPRRHEGCDLDRPADLAAFLKLKSATRSHHYLSALQHRKRMEPVAQDVYSLSPDMVVPA